MNYYYELSPIVVPEFGRRYFVCYDMEDYATHHLTTSRAHLMRNSDRVWREDDNGRVRFIKHRSGNTLTEKVDMKEFFWVKLKSVAV